MVSSRLFDRYKFHHLPKCDRPSQIKTPRFSGSLYSNQTPSVLRGIEAPFVSVNGLVVTAGDLSRHEDLAASNLEWLICMTSVITFHTWLNTCYPLVSAKRWRTHRPQVSPLHQGKDGRAVEDEGVVVRD